jgi:hypothetical protein
LIQFTAKVADNEVDLLVAKPRAFETALAVLLEQAKAKCAGYLNVRFDLPHRPRTTGWKSQNHRINGFIQQMSAATGNDFDALKMVCKREAISEGYPFQTLPNGEVWPKSEAGISIEEATILINTIQRIAAEYNIPLKEE